MKKLNFSLVGFGRFGKNYYREIVKNKKIRCISIIKKNEVKKGLKITKKVRFIKVSKNISLKNVHSGIIASPTTEHFSNSLLFLKKNIPIIIEKPVSDNLKDIKKLNSISRKKKNFSIG